MNLTYRKLKGFVCVGMLAMGCVFGTSVQAAREGHPENVEKVLCYPVRRSDTYILEKAAFLRRIDAISQSNSFVQMLQALINTADWAQRLNEGNRDIRLELAYTLYRQIATTLLEGLEKNNVSEEKEAFVNVFEAEFERPFSFADREIFYEISEALVGAHSNDAQQALADVRAYFEARFGNRPYVISGKW